MKLKMRIALSFTVFCSFVISCRAQQVVDISSFPELQSAGKYYKDLNNNFDAFIGIWEWRNGNEIFRVDLWKIIKNKRENGNRPAYFMDDIEGHYKLLKLNLRGGNLEEVIYNSRRKIGQSNTYWPRVIFGDTHDGLEFSGLVHDNTIDHPKYPLGIRGNLNITIIPGSYPLQAHWTVELPEGMYGTDQPTDFNIPTDIILTKVN